nr:hypothetical protein [Micromonospora sp. DSM 115978]
GLTLLAAETLTGFAEAEPVLGQLIEPLLTAADAMGAALTSRYQGRDLPRYGAKMPYDRDPNQVATTPESWLQQVAGLTRELRSTSYPILRGARDSQRLFHEAHVEQLVERGCRIVNAIVDDAVTATEAAGRARAAELHRAFDGGPLDMAAPAAPLDHPTWRTWRSPDRMHPLLFIVGWHLPGESSITLRVPSLHPQAPVDTRKKCRIDRAPIPTERTMTVPMPQTSVPAILELNADGGVATFDKELVNSVVLRSLLAVPAGRMRCDLYDPMKLGESAGFLFNLGDTAERVLGHKVRTTDRELSDLLNELEEHITTVTQKYLQGTYETLFAYNGAAGEVAEPYRLLVLYDFPTGFVRHDGTVDADLLGRLEKIITAGPRCGVYVLVSMHNMQVSDLAVIERTLMRLTTIREGSSNSGFVEMMCPVPQEQREFVQADRLVEADPGIGVGLTGHGRPGFTQSLARAWQFQPAGSAAPETVRALIGSLEAARRTAEEVRVDERR